MGGEFTYPKMGSPSGFDNHSHLGLRLYAFGGLRHHLPGAPQPLPRHGEAGALQRAGQHPASCVSFGRAVSFGTREVYTKRTTYYVIAQETC